MNRKLHVAFVADGLSYHIEKWLTAIAEQGVWVTLYTFHPPIIETPRFAVRALDIPYSRDGFRYADYWGRARQLKKMLREDKVDVLVGSYATHYGMLAARTRFRPFILQTWTADLTVYPFRGWKKAWYGPVVRYALRRAEAVLTDGAGLADEGRRLFPKHAHKFEPIRWGIRLADYEVDPAELTAMREQLRIPERSTVVTSGRGVRSVDDPELVLPAMLQLLDDRPDTFALVLTLGHERPAHVQAMLDDIYRHPRGRVVDHMLPLKEVRAVWKLSNYLVSMAPEDGISETVLEAMYLGAIPIIRDNPSNRSLIADGARAVVVSPSTPADLLHELENVIDQQRNIRAGFAEHNRAWVEENANVEQSAARLVEIAANLVQRPDRSGVKEKAA